MSNSTPSLAQKLFGNADSIPSGVEELRHTTKRFPFFAPAQFLLLHQLHQEDDEEAADAQHKKAVLYYHNPVQFDYFLSLYNGQSESATDTIFVPEETEVPEVLPVEELRVEEVYHEQEVLYEEKTFEKEETVDEEEKPYEEEKQPEEMSAVIEPGASFWEHVDKDETTMEDNSASLPITEVEVPAEEDVSDQEAAVPVEVTNDVDAVVAVNEADAPVEEFGTTHEVIEAPVITEAHVPAAETQTEGAPVHQQESAISEEPEPVFAPLSKPALENGQPAYPGLSFEPFYTVDYFASQGIKISGEAVEKDKLGRQLKSFTEWLKTMKRLPDAARVNTTEPEKYVEAMADTSVVRADIVTEAMAEVWAKQGNTEKAIETYRKLSLLYPSKSAFFAGKIDLLKTS